MSAANILIVDDEPQIRRVLRATLSANCYAILESSSGEEALESVRKQRPDLVLLDVNMPGMGGIEACRELRRDSDFPIIMLTVRNAERDKVQALDADPRQGDDERTADQPDGHREARIAGGANWC